MAQLSLAPLLPLLLAGCDLLAETKPGDSAETGVPAAPAPACAIADLAELDSEATAFTYLSKIAVAPSGRIAVSGADSAEVLRWKLAGGQLGAEVGGSAIVPGASAYALALSESGERLVVGDTAAKLYLFDAESGAELDSASPGSHPDYPSVAVAVSGEGERIAWASMYQGGDLHLWSPGAAPDGPRTSALWTVAGLAFSPAGDLAVLGDEHVVPAVEIHDPSGALEPVRLWSGAGTVDYGDVVSIGWASGGEIALAGRIDDYMGSGFIAVLEPWSRGEEPRVRLVSVLTGHRPVGMAIWPDGEHFVTFGEEGRLIAWRLSDGALVREIDLGAWGVGMGAAGDEIVVATTDRLVAFGCP